MNSSCNKVLGSRKEYDQVCSQIRRDVDFDSMFNSIILLEIRDYDKVRERIGSLEYDAAVARLSDMIEDHLDEEMIATLYGDGLYMIVIHDAKTPDDIASLAYAVMEDFEKEYSSDGISLISACASCASDPVSLYRCAYDRSLAALAEARSNGSRLKFIGDMKDETMEEDEWQRSTRSQN